MNADELEQRLHRGDLHPVYLLLGEEHLLVEDFFRRLKSYAASNDPVGLNVDAIHAADTDVKRVLSMCRTIPMGGVLRRFVFVRSIDRWAAKVSKQREKGNDAFEHLADYLEAPVPSTVLVLTASKIDGRSKLISRIKAKNYLLACEKLSSKQLVRWVEHTVKTYGCTFQPGVAELLVEAMGSDFAQVADALERVALYVGEGKAIDSTALGELLVRVPASNPFLLIDAVSKRRPSDVLRLLQDVFDPRTSGLPLLGLLAWSVRQLVQMKEALQEGLSPSDAAKQVGIPPFRAQEIAARARNLREHELEKWLLCLAAADLELKSSRRPARSTLESLLLAMTH